MMLCFLRFMVFFVDELSRFLRSERCNWVFVILGVVGFLLIGNPQRDQRKGRYVILMSWRGRCRHFRPKLPRSRLRSLCYRYHHYTYSFIYGLIREILSFSYAMKPSANYDVNFVGMSHL